MAHLQIIVGGETVYDHDAENWQLPPKPDMIGPAVRAQINPNVKPAPFMKALMVAMLAKAIKKALEDPRLHPLDIDLQTRATGWTMSVDIPAPTGVNGVDVMGGE